MKKPKKSAAILAKERAEKEAKRLSDCIAGLCKVGKASRFHFIRKIRQATGYDTETAERHFEGAVARGEIRKAGRNAAGDVQFFECKKQQ